MEFSIRINGVRSYGFTKTEFFADRERSFPRTPIINDEVKLLNVCDCDNTATITFNFECLRKLFE